MYLFILWGNWIGNSRSANRLFSPQGTTLFGPHIPHLHSHSVCAPAQMRPLPTRINAPQYLSRAQTAETIEFSHSRARSSELFPDPLSVTRSPSHCLKFHETHATHQAFWCHWNIESLSLARATAFQRECEPLTYKICGWTSSVASFQRCKGRQIGLRLKLKKTTSKAWFFAMWNSF